MCVCGPWDWVLFLRGLFTLIFEIGSFSGIKLTSCAGIVNLHLNVYPLLCCCASITACLEGARSEAWNPQMTLGQWGKKEGGEGWSSGH